MKKFIYLLIIFLLFNFGNSIAYGEEANIPSVSLNGEFLDGDLIKISAVANNIIDPIIGAAFHLLYENEKVAFLKYEPGEFFETGGDPFYLVQNNENLNKIIFGETLRRDDVFPTGSGKIANFYFQILDGENFNFQFENGVLSTLDTVKQDLSQISWEEINLDKSTNQTLFSAGIRTLVPSLENNKSFPLSSILLLIFAMICSILFIVFIKKRGDKRPESYVNFK